MSGGWNTDPPPTNAFLEKLAAFASCPAADEMTRLARYDEVIDAISTKEDLAQFLLDMSDHIVTRTIENSTVERYWDALAGVILVDAERDANLWRGLARMLDKALYYE
jgi:hypothetical protein